MLSGTTALAAWGTPTLLEAMLRGQQRVPRAAPGCQEPLPSPALSPLCFLCRPRAPAHSLQQNAGDPVSNAANNSEGMDSSTPDFHPWVQGRTQSEVLAGGLGHQASPPPSPKRQLLNLQHPVYLMAFPPCSGSAGNPCPPNTRNKETRHQQRPAQHRGLTGELGKHLQQEHRDATPAEHHPSGSGCQESQANHAGTSWGAAGSPGTPTALLTPTAPFLPSKERSC